MWNYSTITVVQEVSPASVQGNLLGDRFISEDPLHGTVRGS